jgi:hypothetical protein
VRERDLVLVSVAEAIRGYEQHHRLRGAWRADDVVMTGSGAERVCGLRLVACGVRDFYFGGSLEYHIFVVGTFVVGTVSGRREAGTT